LAFLWGLSEMERDLLRVFEFVGGESLRDSCEVGGLFSFRSGSGLGVGSDCSSWDFGGSAEDCPGGFGDLSAEALSDSGTAAEAVKVSRAGSYIVTMESDRN